MHACNAKYTLRYYVRNCALRGLAHRNFSSQVLTIRELYDAFEIVISRIVTFLKSYRNCIVTWDLRFSFEIVTPGPDGISGHVLKTCASQLSGIFRSIFQASLSSHIIPILWNTSTVVPLPKKAHPVIPNDFRPIDLTSHVMKSFEKNHQNHDYEQHSPSSRPSAIPISAWERGGGCSHHVAKHCSWSS